MTATPAGMTYADYLKLDQLLTAQQPLSDLHDEMLFIVIHQTKELWMKELLHELRFAIRLVEADRFAEAYKAMSRISRIQAVMTLSWDVLSTLTPVDYLKFRDVLGTSSGFQSAQFREIEFRLGLKEPNFVNHYDEGSRERAALEQALEEPSLREAAVGALERAGFDLGDRSVEALAAAWLEVYKDAERWFDLYELAEKLVDIDDALAAWRHKHVLTVERIIGNKPGTGGSAGAPYLRATLEKRVFPELWSLRDRSLSFKPLFSRSLSADPDRLHFAAHSHHLWPDASFEGQVEAWNDAARLADRKWDKVMDEVWPEAQGQVARQLGTGQPDAVVFSSNTHDFLVRLVTAAPRAAGRLRVLTTDGEFHSARRQLARWLEEGWIDLERVPAEPFDSLSTRFLDRARSGEHDLILVSRVLFGSGRIFEPVDELAMLGRPQGPWVVIDGYHAFMAIDRPFGETAARTAFYLGGGYKYAMAGEGCAFLHAPPGFAPRPPVTGWFAEFEDLSLPPGSVGYAKDATRFLGATFDPSALYRFNAVQRMLLENGLTTTRISGHVSQLQRQLLEGIGSTAPASAELLNPLDGDPHARFLAFRHADAQRWYTDLKAQNCITDVRGDVLRIGFGVYQDEGDVERLMALLGRLT